MEKISEKDEVEELVQTLEKENTRHTGWEGTELCQYEGFWLRVKSLRPISRFQKYFKPRNNDIILCTNPKCGTTWLKALTFSIANRHIFPIDDQNPLLTSNPHQLVPYLELKIYSEQENPDLNNIPSPRIFSTHLPYQLLPNTIRDDSKCRIIYICRNPLDQFVSRVHFMIENLVEKDAAVDKSFDEFCQGIHPYGPSWDHVRGYWDAHLNNPQKVLVLKYEDLKEDICSIVKKIAEFIELPFTIEEEKQGLDVEQIARLCSFDNLKSLEVNIKGKTNNGVKNSSFFRKGEVGGWANYLTDPLMVERLKNIFQSKLQGSGLEFNFFLK